MNDGDEKMLTTEKKQSVGQQHSMPSGHMVRGIVALLFGIMFLIVASQILLNVLFCLTGLVLIDFGLRVLKIHQVTDYIDCVLAKLRDLRDKSL